MGNRVVSYFKTLGEIETLSALSKLAVTEFVNKVRFSKDEKELVTCESISMLLP